MTPEVSIIPCRTSPGPGDGLGRPLSSHASVRQAQDGQLDGHCYGKIMGNDGFSHLWRFPLNVGTPEWMVYDMQNPMKMDDLGEIHHDLTVLPSSGNHPFI